ncbi:MAG: UDP-3-O-acyl-N-acetylglucosamine deacetylase, partial [Nitrospinota bacterium]
NGHILVVDDEENILTSLEGVLSDEGFKVSKAEDGEMALAILEKSRPDLVLLDIWIPGMDGLQTLKAIKKINPDVEVVMMSGHGTIETAVRATKMGAFDFVEKPISMENILSVVGSALNKSRNIPSRRSIAEQKRMKIIGDADQVKEVRKLVKAASRTDKSVLVRGPTGSGKRFLCGIIFQNSSRKSAPFLSLKCRDFSKGYGGNLVHSRKKAELKESFVQKIRYANGGTVILEGLEDMPGNIQGVLLKIIKERRTIFEGDTVPADVNVRFLSTMTTPPGKLPEERELNQELFSRLSETIIDVPPLKARDCLQESILCFVDEFKEEYGRLLESISPEALNYLKTFDWKQDMEGVKRAVEQIVIRERTPVISLKTVQAMLPAHNLHVTRRSSNDEKKGQLERGGKREGGVERRREQAPRKSARNGAADQFQPQRTLKSSVVLCGHGLHSGLKTGMILSPLPVNSGIIFGDISSGETIPAHIDYVKSTQFATTLKNGGHSVKTIEHVMAVLHMYRITNLLIKMGDEVPVMDGSAVDFCQLIEDGEIEEQASEVEDIIIDRKIEIKEDGKSLVLEPSQSFKVSYFMDYPSPIGEQNHIFQFTEPEVFKKEVAPARTFGFVKDIEKLEEMGLAGGGKLSNFILV